MFKLKWRKRIVVFTLLGALTIGNLENIYAAPTYTEYTNFVTSAEDRCIELDEYINQETSGQYGLLFTLQLLSEYSMYTKFLYENAQIFGISENEKKYYRKNLEEYIKSFNKQYGISSKKFVSLKLKYSTGNDTKFVNSINENLVSIIPNYITKLCDNLKTEVAKAKTSKQKAELKKKKGILLSNIWRIIEVLQETPKEITNLMPYAKKSTSSLEHQTFKVIWKDKSLVNITDKIVKTYADVLEIGMIVASSTKSGEGIVVDTDKKFLENLSNAVMAKDGVQIPEKGELSLAYLATIASSSVYIPFKSYTGNSEFMQTLKSLCKTDESGLKLIALYSKTKDYKKPLYKRRLDDNGFPTGTAKLITIDEFIKEIQSGTSGSLCMIKGAFSFDNEQQAWLYKLKDSDFLEPTTADGILENIVLNQKGSLLPTLTKLNPFSPVKVFAASTTSNIPETNTAAESNSVEKLTEKDLASITFASKEITDDSRITEPVLLWGTSYIRDVDNTTSIILNNILDNVSNFSKIKGSSTKYLYMNAYGDIVTEDNLVILPAICNPLLFKNDSEMNIYSSGIINCYPVTMKNTSYFQLVNRSDVGKYVFALDKATKGKEHETIVSYKIDSLNTVQTNTAIATKALNFNFSANTLESVKLLADERLIVGDPNYWNKDNNLFNYSILQMKNSAIIDNHSVFPYVPEEDSSFKIAKAIGRNMYDFLAKDNETDAEQNLELLNDNYLLHNILMQGLNGTDNAIGFEKNQILEYDQFVNSAGERIRSYVLSFVKPIVNKVSDVDGVLGLKNCYQDNVFGKVFDSLRENWVIFIFIVAIIFLYVFARMRSDLLQTGIMMVCCLIVSYLFVAVIPVYLPMFFNIVINNVSEVFTYKTLASKLEAEGANEINIKLDEDGHYRLNTTSMTLYRVAPTRLKELQEDLNVESFDLTAGKSVIINQESGLFAEGDSLKVNLSLLSRNLKIIGEQQTLDGNFVYHLKSYKTVSDNIDYYVPYYKIVDCFINKLNTLASIYELPRRTVAFFNGNKENYLVYSYVNSKPFLLSGKYGTTLPEDTTGWTDQEKEEYVAVNSDLAQALNEAFGMNVDYLGINEFLYNLGEAEKKTLWAKTMQANGYYDKEWNVNEEKMNHLIDYVNFQTRKFIYDMQDQIGNISDDVMIKIISLRALVALSQKSSEYFTWMYPFCLNYEEMPLGDVLTTTLCNDYGDFVQSDMDLSEYIVREYGWFHLIVFTLVSVFLFLAIYIIRIFVPITYLIFGVVLILRMLKQSDIKVSIKGYLKSMLVAMGSFTCMTISFVLAKKMNHNVIALYFMLLSVGLVLWLLSIIVYSILINVGEFGNSAIDVKFSGMLSHLPALKQHFVEINQMRVGRRREYPRREYHNSNTKRSDFSRYSNQIDPDYYYSNRNYEDVYREEDGIADLRISEKLMHNDSEEILEDLTQKYD